MPFFVSTSIIITVLWAIVKDNFIFVLPLTDFDLYDTLAEYPAEENRIHY